MIKKRAWRMEYDAINRWRKKVLDLFFFRTLATTFFQFLVVVVVVVFGFRSACVNEHGAGQGQGPITIL